MKKGGFKSIISATFALIAAVVFAAQVSAMTPNLSVVSNGTGSIQTTVYADANSTVLLNYYSGGQLMGAGVIGYTNYSGYFNGTLNTYQYPMIPNGAQIVVSVNGQQSLPAIWPNTGYNNQYPNYNTGVPSLSQSNVTLTQGQSQTITVSNNTGYYNTNQFYLSNNLNNVVSATISGNTITLYGTNIGTTTLRVCSNDLVSTISYGLGNYGGSCATVYVTVTAPYYNPTYPVYPPVYPPYPTYPTYPQYPIYNTPLSVSNSNVQVTVGNSGAVTVYGTNNGYNNYSYNAYYVTNNNSSIASATVNGNVLNVYGMAPGTTNVTVCSTQGNQCATVYVTVINPYNNYPYYNNGNNWYLPLR